MQEPPQNTNDPTHRVWLQTFPDQLTGAPPGIIPLKFIDFIRSLIGLIDTGNLPDETVSPILSVLGGLPAQLQDLTAATQSSDLFQRRRALCALALQMSSVYITVFENVSSDTRGALIVSLLDHGPIQLATLPDTPQTGSENQDGSLSFTAEVDWNHSPLKVNHEFFGKLFITAEELVGVCRGLFEPKKKAKTDIGKARDAADNGALNTRMTLTFVMMALGNMMVDVPLDVSERVSWFRRLAELMKTFYGALSDVLLLPWWVSIKNIFYLKKFFTFFYFFQQNFFNVFFTFFLKHFFTKFFLFF